MRSPAATALLAGLLAGLLAARVPAAVADCGEVAQRSVDALVSAGLLAAGDRAAAQAVLTERCSIEDRDRRTSKLLGVEFRRADPDSAGNRRLGNRH